MVKVRVLGKLIKRREVKGRLYMVDCNHVVPTELKKHGSRSVFD